MRRFFSKTLTFIKWLIIIFLASSVLAVVAYKYIPVKLSPLMLIRCCQQVKRGETLRLKHEWVSYDKISPDLSLAVMASEDQNFLKHSGFDLNAIETALKESAEGKRRRGGSTISQQTAKNVFLWPASSWLRKGFEVYFTVLIEFFWDKQRIMEVYLNTIEMGDGIYGAEAVAREHFGCDASELSRRQCALIAATLPNPIRFDSSNPSRYMYKRQAWIMKQMRWVTPIGSKEDDEQN